MEDIQVVQPVELEAVPNIEAEAAPVIQEEAPADPVEAVESAQQAEACESCNTVTELFDVPHHQVGNPKVWRYCHRCQLAHTIEIATNEKLKEIMVVNQSAVNDPEFVGQVRDQLTKEIMQA